jgi:hypothetical protein
VFEGLCHTVHVAFTEVPDAEAGQIEALLLSYSSTVILFFRICPR